LNGHTPRKLPVLGVPKRQPFASSHIKLVYYTINRIKLQHLFTVVFVEILMIKTTKNIQVAQKTVPLGQKDSFGTLPFFKMLFL
jgi:hypothetical protein